MMVAEIFANAVKRATERALPIMELLGAAGALQNANEITLVKTLYQTWIDHNKGDPLMHAVLFNQAVVLSGTEDLHGARAALTEAIRLAPDFMPPYINLGNVLEKLGAVGEAVTQWYTVVNKLPAVTADNLNYRLSALKQVGRVLERAYYDEQAEDALRLSLELNPNQSDVAQHWFSLRQRQCKWPIIKPWATVTREQIVNGISALSLAAYTDDPFLCLANAARYAKNNIGRAKTSYMDAHAKRMTEPSPARRKVGYLSSDLREHAIGFLTSELFEVHNREKIEVFLYYCGHKVTDGVQARIKASAEHWIDISEMGDEQAAKQMMEDGIEILIDVNGYTHSARTKLLAMQPAPIIVNWLGFPGSMGSAYHHYLIADDFIIPPESEVFYSEKVMRVPCYQPNDRKRVIAPIRPSRADVGLPEDAMVFCCFNGVHKITPFTWRRWMDILKAVPNSVLWLLAGTLDATHERLRQSAIAHGVPVERIIFAPKQHNPQHLARYPLADLFLDTAPYGAHTTSSDALWMGVPVLTWAGRGFATRVCGSLLKSAGLEDLICTTREQYVTKAIDLGTNRAKLAEVRARLAKNRDTCVLFDTNLMAASLEKVYEQMWAEFRAGKLPRPNLTNLEIYNDIGVELDKDSVELMCVPNYLDIYREKFVDKDHYAYLPPDGRLWPGGKKP